VYVSKVSATSVTLTAQAADGQFYCLKDDSTAAQTFGNVDATVVATACAGGW
jgi:hypothetical protein